MPTLTTLASFNGADGELPLAKLIIDAAGNLFGTTEEGGAHNDGTVFELVKAVAGYATTPTTLLSLDGIDGQSPTQGALFADAAGDLFDAAPYGGVNGDGTVIELLNTAKGYVPTVLVTFDYTNANPVAGVIVDAAGNLIGATPYTGIVYRAGAIFEIAKTSTGYASVATTLVTFNGADGASPFANLITDAAGNLFGTTASGSALGDGTIFELAKTPAGYASTPTTLATFDSADGTFPGALAMDAAGNLFGTTEAGGASNEGIIFELAKTSTGYASNPATLVSFSGNGESYPSTGLLVDAAGNLFGTGSPSPSNAGTVFELARTITGYASTLTNLATFDVTDGSSPSALVADAKGNLFGTTAYGGSSNQGTIFEVSGAGFQLTPPASTPATTIGSGADTIALQVSEDAYLGNAQFTVSVDGVQVGGVQTATAQNSLLQSQVFNVDGNFGAGPHTVVLNFLNDAYSTPFSLATDRNLYVDSATFDGAAIPNAALALLAGGPEYFTFGSPPPALPAPITVGSGPDDLQLAVAEDTWHGDAQFTVSVDGVQVGGVLTATASQALQQTQTINVLAAIGAGAHTVSVDFLNDRFDGLGFDRNLYVDGATLDGRPVLTSTLALLGDGPQAFGFSARPTTTVGSGPDALVLQVSEDAYLGDAQFTISVDGVQVGGVQTATALHDLGQSQTFNVLGNFGATAHTLTVDFLNDAYGNPYSPATDRNLYVGGATIDGAAVPNSALTLLTAGNQNITFGGPQTAEPAAVTAGSGPDVLAVSLSEDAYLGDAMATISVDGTPIVGYTITASHAAGQSQTLNARGYFGAGPHTVTVDFLNDAYSTPYSPAMDRNLYVDAASINGAPIADAKLALLNTGTEFFTYGTPPAPPPTPVTIGIGSDDLVLSVSEDAWQGDAQFILSVDGKQVGGQLTATASHAAGQEQLFNVLGSFGPGSHVLSVDFLNDLNDGPGFDRNLYVDGATINGAAVPNASLALLSSGTQSLTFPGHTAIVPVLNS